MIPFTSDPGEAGRTRALVIGAGVSGLTTALCLARRGFGVTILADRVAPGLTSNVAGALWEWPPAVCGQHQDEVSLGRSKAWCATSYPIFEALAADPATGVHLRPVNFYFRSPVEADPRQLPKRDEVRAHVRGFRHDPALIAEAGVNPGLGIVDAYSYLAPMIDTDVYLGWLLAEFRALGGRVVPGRVDGPILDGEAALLDEHDASAIVVCAGLGAKELTGEPVVSLRGALIRVRNDGRAMPRIDSAHCVSRDGDGPDRGFLFVVPRGGDRLVLGGLAEADEWSVDVGLDNHEPIREMYRRCVEFLPALRHAEIDAAEPVRVGLRPYRSRGVRLEAEAGTRIVHNYGHGGSGVTLSWGCALEVAGLVESLVQERAVAPG